MNELTFAESIWLALAFGGVVAGIGLVILGLFFADNDGPTVGLDIFDDPRERGNADDPTGEQLVAGMDLLRDTAPRDDLGGDEDPYEDWTYIAPSPLAWHRTIGGRATGNGPTAPPRPLHEHGRAKGDVTLAFEAYAEHEGHPVREHGPDETQVLIFTSPMRRRGVKWIGATR